MKNHLETLIGKIIVRADHSSVKKCYPIGIYSEENPLYVHLTSDSDTTKYQTPKYFKTDWEYEWNFSDKCEDYRAADEYFLKIRTKEVILLSRSERGLFYGLITFKNLLKSSNNHLKPLTVQDGPQLHLRAVHIDLKKGAPKASYLEEQAVILSSMKINSLMIEWEDKYPFNGELETLKHPAALTEEERDNWLKTCHTYYLEVFPLVQSLGHMQYVLKHEKFVHLSETAGIKPKSTRDKKEHHSQMCPLRPEVKDFVWEMHSQIQNGMGPHKRSRFVHIGMDETRNLGKCSKCSVMVEKDPEKGKSKLYVDHLNWIAKKYEDLGKYPIVWNDMLEEEYQLLDQVNPDLWICDWEYDHPIPSQGEPLHERVEQIDPTGESVNWVRTRESKTSKQLKNNPPASIEIFGDFWWLGDGKYSLRSFPYSKFFHEKGFKVVAAPAVQCCGINPIVPCYARRYPNIVYFNQYASKYGIEGSILTNWVVRYALWPLLEFGFVAHAETCWTGKKIPEEDLFNRFVQQMFFNGTKNIPSEEIEGLGSFFSLIGYVGEEYEKIARLRSLNAFKDAGADIGHLINQVFPKIEQLEKKLRYLGEKIKTNEKYFRSMLLGLQYVKVVKGALTVGNDIEKIALNYDSEENCIPEMSKLNFLASKLEMFATDFETFEKNLGDIVQWYLHTEEIDDYLEQTLLPVKNHLKVLQDGFRPFYDALNSFVDIIVSYAMKRFQ